MFMWVTTLKGNEIADKSEKQALNLIHVIYYFQETYTFILCPSKSEKTRGSITVVGHVFLLVHSLHIVGGANAPKEAWLLPEIKPRRRVEPVT